MFFDLVSVMAVAILCFYFFSPSCLIPRSNPNTRSQLHEKSPKSDVFTREGDRLHSPTCLKMFSRSFPSSGKGIVTPRSGGYRDVTATYIRRSEIPSRIYAKHQYRQESEDGSTWCIIHSNTRVQLQSYHRK